MIEKTGVYIILFYFAIASYGGSAVLGLIGWLVIITAYYIFNKNISN